MVKPKPVQFGTTRWAGAEYDGIDKQGYVQAVEWPNGEGLTIFVDDRPGIDVTWEECAAISKAVRKVKSVWTNNG